MANNTSSDDSVESDISDLTPLIRQASTFEALVTVLDEHFVFPKPCLRYETDRISVAKVIAETAVKHSIDLDLLLDFLCKKRADSRDTGLLKSIFTTSIVREDQELVRATASLSLGEIAKVMDEDALVIRLRKYFWEPLLSSIRAEDSPEALMGAVGGITRVSVKVHDARNISVDPSLALLRDDIVIALIGLVAYDDPKGKQRYSMSSVLTCIASLLNIRRLQLASSVFKNVLETALRLTFTDRRQRRVAAVCRVLNVLTKSHAQTWNGVGKILHAVDASRANPEVFLEVCSCSPALQPSEFPEFADCLALALSQGSSGTQAVRRILNAGRFPNLDDALLALPNDVVGSFCESLIARDCECSLVLSLLRLRARDLSEYFSARLISMFFGKNRKYFDCIQYIAEIHLETTVRKILEHAKSGEDLEGLDRLITDRLTALQALRVLADLVSNTDPSDSKSYAKLTSAFLFFLRLNEDWLKWEIRDNFNDYFTCILVNYIQSPDSFRDCLLAIAPSDQFAETVMSISESTRKQHEEFPAQFCQKFPHFLNASLAKDFLVRPKEQRIAAAAMLCGAGAAENWLDALKSDSDARCRKFAVRATNDAAVLLDIIKEEANTVLVLPEALRNAARNIPALTLKLASVSDRVHACLRSFEERPELICGVLELIAVLDFDKPEITAELFILLLLQCDNADSEIQSRAVKAIDTCTRVCLKGKGAEIADEVVSKLTPNQSNWFESLVDTLLSTELLQKEHLNYCKSLAMNSSMDTAPHYVIATLATLAAKLSRQLDPKMNPSELRRLVSIMIGFASLSDIEVTSRGKVVSAMRHFVYIGDPWLAEV